MNMCKLIKMEIEDLGPQKGNFFSVFLLFSEPVPEK